MNEVTWERPYKHQEKKWGQKRKPVDLDYQEKKGQSFADRFLADNQEAEVSQWSGGYSSNYNEYYQEFAGNQTGKEPSRYPGNYHEDFHKQPYGSHQQQTQWSQPVQSYDPRFNHPGMTAQPEPGPQESNSLKMRFFDLKSRKQTGDLHKRMLAYNRKSDYASFCFTSTTANEGVTTILANLVNYIRNQESDRALIVIDANLGAPGWNRIFGIPSNYPGLIEVIDRQINLASALVPVGGNIQVLCTGNPGNYNRNSIEPDVFLKMIQMCKTMADFVLIDCPPILISSDVFSVAPAADITFLVVQAVKMRRQVAEKGISELRDLECKVGGIVMNRVQQVIPAWVYRYI